MIERLSLLTALVTASAMARAHANLPLDGTLHRLLHAIGSERLVVLGGTLLAVVVGLLVRYAARKASRRTRREG